MLERCKQGKFHHFCFLKFPTIIFLTLQFLETCDPAAYDCTENAECIEDPLAEGNYNNREFMNQYKLILEILLKYIIGGYYF